MKAWYITLGILVLGIVGFGLYGVTWHKDTVSSVKGPVSGSDVYDTFATCLSEKGAKFYGAFWCPHCKEQKRMLHESTKLPYIECSNPDGKSQTDQCKKENIVGYPTWRFSDGSELGGEQTPSVLAEKTGCTIPN